MTDALTVAIGSAGETLAGSSVGHLPRPARIAVLEALGDYEPGGVGHQRRFLVALGAHEQLDAPRLTLAGDLALPLLDGRWGDPILDGGRDVARRAMRAMRDDPELRARVARARERLDERTKARPGVALAARASIALVTAALEDQPVSPDTGDLDDESTDPGNWSVEFCVSAGRTGLPSEGRDAPARRAFWRYWLQRVEQHATMRRVIDGPFLRA